MDVLLFHQQQCEKSATPFNSALGVVVDVLNILEFKITNTTVSQLTCSLSVNILLKHKQPNKELS
jgi:hypothetical protein